MPFDLVGPLLQLAALAVELFAGMFLELRGCNYRLSKAMDQQRQQQVRAHQVARQAASRR